MTYIPNRITRVLDLERALEEVRAPGLYRYFGASLEVGRSARLLETIRGLEHLDKTRLYDFASQFGYIPRYVDAEFLPRYQALGLVAVDGDNVSVALGSRQRILEVCDAEWEGASKDPHDEVSIGLLTSASRRPQKLEDLQPRLEERYGKEAVELSLQTLEATNMIRRVPLGGETFLVNPYTLPLDAQRLRRLVSDLSTEGLAQLDQASDQVWQSQGYPLTALLKSGVVNKTVVDAGLLSGVLLAADVTTPHTSQTFLFTADALPPIGVDGDAFHLAKQAVAHFRYAQTFPQYRLHRLDRFLEVLITAGEAGRATPIGTDYRALEQLGLIEVRKLGASGKFRMYLVPGKKAILEQVRSLVSSGVSSIPSLTIEPVGEQLKRIRVPPEARANIDPSKLQSLLEKVTDRLRRL